MIGEDGRMTAAAGERFAGMTVLEAREAVVDALRAEGRIARTEQYLHNVPYSQRSGERIEPLISLQWFMRMDELAKPAIEVVRNGRIAIHPEGQERALPRVDGEHPPLVHLAPALVGPPDPRLVPRRRDATSAWSRPQGDGWERDPDVLDTWFSSALWPFVTLGWPERHGRAARVLPDRRALDGARHPVPLGRAHGHDRDSSSPATSRSTDVYVHSIIQAPDGRRMSKSLGTGIDPLDLIDGGPRPPVFEQGGDFPAYGADAVRFGLLAMSSTPGRALQRGEDRPGPPARQQALERLPGSCCCASPRALDGARAAPPAQAGRGRLDPLAPAGRQGRRRALDRRFEFHHAALGLYDFVYGDLCDWYLEMVKPRLYADDNRDVAELALHVLAETLALAHPIIPFVTEEIWSHMPGADGAADGPPLPGARRGAARRGRRGRRSRARSRRRRSCAAGATASARPPASSSPPGSRRAGYDRTAAHVARLARVEWSADGGEPVATVGVPGGSIAVLASEAVDLEAAARRADARRATLREGDRARRGQARQPGLRRQGARRRRRGRAREARPPQAGAGGALVTRRGASRTPRPTCSRSSCSACASGSSGCGGC